MVTRRRAPFFHLDISPHFSSASAFSHKPNPSEIHHGSLSEPATNPSPVGTYSTSLHYLHPQSKLSSSLPPPHHPPAQLQPQPNLADRRHPCSQCAKTFTRASDVKRHELTHNNDRKFYCPAPGCVRGEKGFTRKDKLMDHWKVKHPDWEYDDFVLG